MNKSEPAQDNAHPVTRLQKTKKKTKEKNKQILHLCKTQRAHAWRVWRQTAHSYFFLFIPPPPAPLPPAREALLKCFFGNEENCQVQREVSPSESPRRLIKDICSLGRAQGFTR